MSDLIEKIKNLDQQIEEHNCQYCSHCCEECNFYKKNESNVESCIRTDILDILRDVYKQRGFVKEHYAWTSYNPKGRYYNVCLTVPEEQAVCIQELKKLLEGTPTIKVEEQKVDMVDIAKKVCGIK